MFSSQNSQVSNDANYIEDVFSTYLYTGNGSTQTITNGIDLSTYGGLVWTKNRQDSDLYHVLSDSATGPNNVLRSNSAAAAFTYTGNGWSVPVFSTNGYTTSNSGYVSQSVSGLNQFVSWTFRKQPKFFTCGTYTGTGSTQTITHDLGSAPGCIIIKKIDSTTYNAGWAVYHRSLTNPNNYYLRLDLTNAEANYGGSFISNVTSTSFDVNGASGLLGLSGSSYVYYAFAHNAGGFGLTGTDNVISCGSFTTDGSGNASVNLGYEPQWIMAKAASGTVSDWFMYDNMRGLDVSNGSYLRANSSASETAVSPMRINATGFSVANSTFDASATYIYIAIRRGPMKVPTTGTSVYAPVYANTSSYPYTVTTNFPVDLAINRGVDPDYQSTVTDRLRGSTTTSSSYLLTDSTAAEASSTGGRGLGFQNNTAIIDNNFWAGYGLDVIYWNFRRAPSFFDEVCYTGTGSATTVTHNLQTVPQLIIVKNRSNVRNWFVWVNGFGTTDYLELNTTNGIQTGANIWNSTAPTSTVFSVNGVNNTSSDNFVSYLFATCAGVSKVGSYTGTGTTLQVNCGFTGGARFVLIKRTDSTGDWYVWDTARGIVSGNDPYLLLNSTAAEVTSTDYIDTYSAGFEISSTAPAAINASGGTFIFLAIA